MPRLSETISRLKALKANMSHSTNDRLTELTEFGPNPGALRAWLYVPEVRAPGAALVVVMHGCTQSAASYDHGSGWSELAEAHGFALLFPEQSNGNNPAGCFNWFLPDDVRRGGGEAMSVHQMISATIDRHDIDPARVFITGLSAGAASAVAMLATYPEVFAGGAVIAGLPYGCASSVREALGCMQGQGLPPVPALEAKLRAASSHKGPWPTISVWHGTADHTVVPTNGEAIAAQWRAVHGLPDEPSLAETVGGHQRRVWRDVEGREPVEVWRIAGMGHGTPIDTGPGGCGTSGPFMLDVGVSSTQRIANRWGLVPAPADAASGRVGAGNGTTAVGAAHRIQGGFAARPMAASDPAGGSSRVGQIIEDALRAAGLMR